MRKTLLGVLELFQRLAEAKRRLHAEMDACLKRIYTLARKKSVTARPKRDPDGLLRRIQFVFRSKGKATVNGQKYPLHETLRSPITPAFVYEVIRDYPHVEQWVALYREATTFNANHAPLAFVHRDLRAALSNKFIPWATSEDRSRASTILRSLSILLPGDEDALLGAVVYDRQLQDLERRISERVLGWKEAMRSVPFEPLIRWRAAGPLRLSWAYVERFYDSERNLQVRSHEISGGVTDRWLRPHYPGGGVAQRQEILGFATPLRKLVREYSGLLVYVGRLKGRVRRVLDGGVNGARPVAGAAR